MSTVTPPFDPKPLPASSLAVMEIDPSLLDPAPGNRPVDMDSVSDILPAMERDGQHIPGLIYPNPEKTGRQLVADGNRRAFCCGVLKIKFKAVALEEAPSEAALSRLRVILSLTSKASNSFDRAFDIYTYIKLTQCTQERAAKEFGISEPRITTLLRPIKLCPQDVLDKIRSGVINRSVGYAISRCPDHEAMRHLADKAERGLLTRNSAIKFVNGLLNGGKKREKLARANVGGVPCVIPADLQLALRVAKAQVKGIEKAISLEMTSPSAACDLIRRAFGEAKGAAE